MNSFVLLGYIASVLLNAWLLGMRWRDKRAARHVHDWTPWTEWRQLDKYEYGAYRVWFQRRRYCSECAVEEKQEVGSHKCEELSDWKKSVCPHTEMFTGVFDPMYEIRQINKDLKELQ